MLYEVITPFLADLLGIDERRGMEGIVSDSCRSLQVGEDPARTLEGASVNRRT